MVGSGQGERKIEEIKETDKYRGEGRRREKSFKVLKAKRQRSERCEEIKNYPLI